MEDARKDREAFTQVDRTMRLLGALADGTIERLVPEMDETSPSAYGYPEARRYLDVASGAEIPVLNALVDHGILLAEHIATVPVCPFCHTYALRVERFCSSCGSSAVHRTEMIHHFRCGNVSPEETYHAHGEDLVCPKCERTLRHIGVDYERPSAVWLCDDCGTVMDAPQLRYVSLTCGRKVPIDDVVDRAIHAYSLSADGRLLINEGDVRAALVEPAARDALTGLPSAGAMARTIELERARSERYETSFSVVRLSLDNGEELDGRFGEAAVARVVRTLATIARERLRAVDLLTRDGIYSLGAVLPETDTVGAQAVLDKLVAAADEYLHAEGRDETHRAARVVAEVLDTPATSSAE